MVRCVMYLSVGTVFIWNARVTSNILALTPNANNMDLGADASNDDKCDATAINVMIIVMLNILCVWVWADDKCVMYYKLRSKEHIHTKHYTY